MGFVCFSQCSESDWKCRREDYCEWSDWDLCDRSYESESSAGETSHLSTCEYTNNNTHTHIHTNTVIIMCLSLSQGYLLSCAESLACQSDSKPLPDCLRWIFTPLGRQFFLSCDWSVRSESSEQIFTSQRDEGKTNTLMVSSYYSNCSVLGYISLRWAQSMLGAKQAQITEVCLTSYALRRPINLWH